ncbi:MAG TPA: integrase, partial [Burkholderiales bacterium]|nr:integrase [Burkholderiales bacterium]
MPLTPFALEQLKPLRELNGETDYLFSADGKTPMVVETLSKAVAEVAKEQFDQRDIRRTVETTLQKLGVDREVRAHLLSHGRTKGVQGQHYERYDFLPEKRQALERWT